jgi:hypothetical protein
VGARSAFSASRRISGSAVFGSIITGCRRRRPPASPRRSSWTTLAGRVAYAADTECRTTLHRRGVGGISAPAPVGSRA